MKLKALALAVVLGVMGVCAMSGAAGAANTCPTGSAREGKAIGSADAPTYADCNLPATLPTKDVPTVAQTIINVMVSVVGIVAVLVIVIGGILYVTSTGDAAKAKRAQSAILYGVIGLIVAVLAYAIVNFVLKSVF